MPKSLSSQQAQLVQVHVDLSFSPENLSKLQERCQEQQKSMSRIISKAVDWYLLSADAINNDLEIKITTKDGVCKAKLVAI